MFPIVNGPIQCRRIKRDDYLVTLTKALDSLRRKTVWEGMFNAVADSERVEVVVVVTNSIG